MKHSMRFTLAMSALLLQGCENLTPLNYEMHPTGGELRFVKTGCMVRDATFKDTTGNGYGGGMFRMVSVNAIGDTMDDYYFSCKPTAPNGTTRCAVAAVGSTTTYMSYGGPGCPDLRRFMLVR
jgi:hypothetical protein